MHIRHTRYKFQIFVTGMGRFFDPIEIEYVYSVNCLDLNLKFCLTRKLAQVCKHKIILRPCTERI